MTCPTCAQMCATSEEQLAIRQRNMAAMPNVTPAPCPQCGSTAWATSREMIKARPVPNRWWHNGVPTHDTLMISCGVVAVFCVAQAIVTGPSWVGMIDMFLGGLNAAAVFYNYIQKRSRIVLDALMSFCEELCETKMPVTQMQVRQDDDHAPIAPRLH